MVQREAPGSDNPRTSELGFFDILFPMSPSGFDNNRKFASLLRQMAALLEEDGVAFKPAAYRRAAQTITDLDKDIAEINDVKEFKKLPGVGEAIATKAVEFLSTGRIPHLDALIAQHGGLSEELMMIEDLGPKRVRQIEELGIHKTEELIEAAKAGKLRDLPRFSEVIEKKILDNALNVEERSRRIPLEDAKPRVQKLLKALRAVPGVHRAEAAGSYRREKETVGDIDIVAVTDDADTVSHAIAALPFVEHVAAHGGTKLSFNLEGGLRTDIRFVKPDQWGSALLYFTGSKEHNIMLRKRAIERGWKLNEYALFEGDKVIASKEEEDIYKALDLPWMEPAKRI